MEHEQFAGELPSFATDTWPLIESKRDAISGLFYRKRPEDSLLDLLPRQETAIPGFFRLGRLAEMGSNALDCVFTAADSELSLFFETKDQWFLRQLCSLWPRPGVLRVGKERLERFSDLELDLLNRATSDIPPDHVWFAFDDEGWLLYVFGAEGLLAWAQQSRGFRQQAEIKLVELKPETETPSE